MSEDIGTVRYQLEMVKNQLEVAAQVGGISLKCSISFKLFALLVNLASETKLTTSLGLQCQTPALSWTISFG